MASKLKVDACEGANERLSYGIASSQGHRPDMQDAHAVILDVDNDGMALFAVFDGHGGSEGAKHCAEAVGDTLRHALASAQKRKASGGPDLTVALRDCILELDEQVLEHYSKRQGSTATLALLRGSELVVADVGDSRALLARDGQPVELTRDHKPTDPEEQARIKAAGGHVSHRGRVQDNLNMLRALGDGQFKDESLPPKEQMVSPEPDISQVWLSSERDEWLLLASDGLWNALAEEEALKAGKALRDTAKSLIALANKPSHTAHDNVTVILVQPKQLPAEAPEGQQEAEAPAEAATHMPEARGSARDGADADASEGMGAGGGDGGSGETSAHTPELRSDERHVGATGTRVHGVDVAASELMGIGGEGGLAGGGDGGLAGGEGGGLASDGGGGGLSIGEGGLNGGEDVGLAAKDDEEEALLRSAGLAM